MPLGRKRLRVSGFRREAWASDHFSARGLLGSRGGLPGRQTVHGVSPEFRGEAFWNCWRMELEGVD